MRFIMVDLPEPGRPHDGDVFRRARSAMQPRVTLIVSPPHLR